MKKGMVFFLTAVLSFTMIFTPLPVMATDTAAEEMEQDVQETTEDYSVRGMNSAGDLISQAITEKRSEQEANNGYNVYAVEMNGKQAKVSFDTVKNCTLLVAIYDEAGQRMLASGKKEVKPDEKEAVVTIETSSMPQYFYVKAFLIDSKNLNPLCTAYDCPNYTKEMTQFLEKTVNDFDSEQVVNFDENKKNNFAVYADDVKTINRNQGKNLIAKEDDTNKQYVIKHADKQISSLKKGDIFVYEYEKGKILIVKVKSIKISGTTVTITGDDTGMEEVFDYVKIDTNSSIDEAEVDNSQLEEDITYQGEVDFDRADPANMMQAQAVDIEGKVSNALAYSFDKKKWEGDKAGAAVKGGVVLRLDSGVKVYHQKSYNYVEIKFEASMKVAASVDGEINLGKSLGKLSYSPIPCVTITVTPRVDVKFSGGMEIAVTVKTTSGAVYSSDKGYQEIKSAPSVDPKVKASGTFYIGLGLKPAVSVVNEKILSIYFDASAGLEINVSTDILSLPKEKVKHDCKLCLDGETSFKSKVSFGVKFFDKHDVKVTVFEGKAKLFDFYFSITRGEFGFGNCPHILYKVTITTKDSDGKPVEGVAVKGGQKEYLSDKNGQVVLWLGNDTYHLALKKADYQSIEKTVTVHDASEDIDFTLYEAPKLGHEVTVTVTDEAGAPVADASVNGVITDTQGKAVVRLANGLQTIVVEKDGYARIEQSVNVEEDTREVSVSIKKGEAAENPGEVVDGTGPKIQSISLGEEYSGAITKDGNLYMWGDNLYGQLGDDTEEDSIIPKKIMSNVQSISLRFRHSGAITKNGDLYMWGENYSHELGDGTIESSLIPKKIMSNVQTVSVGILHSGAIAKNGDLYMWGGNGYGQLGYDTTKPHAVTPKKIMSNVQTVSLGGYCSGAITKDGDLYMWGSNSDGQLGDGTREASLTPKKIMSNVQTVSLGEYYSGAITKDGDLYMWGSNSDGQLGDGTREASLTPKKIMSDVQSVSLGGSFQAYNGGAITKDGDLYMWGSNRYGQLGDGTREASLTPKKVMSNVQSVSFGAHHRGVITKTGNLYMWGSNSDGQLGDGTTEGSLVPKKITIPTSSASVKLASMGNAAASSENEVVAPASNLKVAAASMLHTAENVSTSTQTKSFNGLQPKTLHNFYVVKDRNCENPLSANNLLYIGQGMSNKNGKASFQYAAREGHNNAEIFVVGIPEDDISFYKPSLKNFTYAYTGKAIKPLPRVVISSKILKKNRDYTVSYSNNKKIGTAKITVKGKGDYSGSKTITFKIVPKKVSIFSAKSLTKKNIQVKWKKVSQAGGYQIRYSKSNKFSSPKTVKVESGAKTSCRISKLSRGKKYFVKVRAYKVVNGTAYYGKWSTAKTVRVK
ncbi:fibronectin type III domain-containing protein [Ihubacter sp. mB4P-1]|uniref:RCC1 domain-containing protein n=1 Tax=Ihubacter sp. mB4P-1 TaxID=3242370 RepID=UPI003C7E27B0